MSRASVALGVIVAFLAGGAAALLVSSADDERGSATTVTTALQATTPAQEQLRVDEREYRLDEADPRVRAGVIAILATNSGAKTHALAVETPHGEIRSEDIEPRESTRLKVDLAPGRYAWFCPIDDHQTRGMAGTIRVAAPRRVVRERSRVEEPARTERTVRTVTAPPRTETRTVTTTRTVTVETAP